MIRDTDLSSSQLSKALSSRQPASVLWIKWDFDEEWGLLLNALYFFLLSTSSWMSKPTFQVSYSVVGLLEITTASACHVWDLILLSTGPKTMMSVGDDAKVMVKASSGNTVPQLFTRPHRHHYLFSRLSRGHDANGALLLYLCCWYRLLLLRRLLHIISLVYHHRDLRLHLDMDVQRAEEGHTVCEMASNWCRSGYCMIGYHFHTRDYRRAVEGNRGSRNWRSRWEWNTYKLHLYLTTANILRW